MLPQLSRARAAPSKSGYQTDHKEDIEVTRERRNTQAKIAGLRPENTAGLNLLTVQNLFLT